MRAPGVPSLEVAFLRTRSPLRHSENGILGSGSPHESPMNSSARSFAFVKIGDFSGCNDQVLAQLRAQFPDLEADVIDVLDFRIVSRSNAAQLLWSVAREYGLSSCLTRSRFHARVLRTQYFFSKVRQQLLQRLSSNRYVFTFQTQSLVDASIPGIPHFLYTDHTHLANLMYPGKQSTPRASSAWLELEKSIYQHARMNFTMSSHVSRSLVEHYGCPEARVECVYAGGNATTVDSDTEGEKRFARKKILFVGIDWKRKGGPDLLRAFREVRRSHPTAELTIVGCSPNVSVPGCRVEGRVPVAEVSKYFRSASIFCMPTTVEPFGVVFVEAFAHGLPIVATNIGAIPDLIEEGESGFMVPCNDPAQLANRLNCLLADPARCGRFGAHGRALVNARYTWKATGLKLADHIKHCVAVDARPAQVPAALPACDMALDAAAAQLGIVSAFARIFRASG